jgi:hypothetical protein
MYTYVDEISRVLLVFWYQNCALSAIHINTDISNNARLNDDPVGDTAFCGVP